MVIQPLNWAQKRFNAIFIKQKPDNLFNQIFIKKLTMYSFKKIHDYSCNKIFIKKMLYRRAILTMKRRLKLRIAKFSFKFEKIIVQISKCICQKCICQLLQNVFFQNYKLYLSKLHSVFVKVILSI